MMDKEVMSLKEAIEHAEQKAADEHCSCRYDHQQLAKWLKELREYRKEHGILEKPLGKEYACLFRDLEQLVCLANEMAFDGVDISIEQSFVWRSVKEIAFRASNALRRVKYFKKQEVSNQ